MAEAMDEDMPEDTASLEKDLTCALCYRIYRDPVLLPCTHSFCRECLQTNQRFNRRCPLCRKEVREGKEITNRALSAACETFLKYASAMPTQTRAGDDMCRLHMKQLLLYCEKDEEPVCEDCVPLHTTHEHTHKLWRLQDGATIAKVRCAHL